MPDSSAFGPDADNGSLVQLTITQLNYNLSERPIHPTFSFSFSSPMLPQLFSLQLQKD